jgi:uncharacterized damage-inducible protein DinB
MIFQRGYPSLMAEYNRWMNERLYAFCADMTDELRRRDLGAFFKSIHGTLDHILGGDRLWLARFNGKTYPSERPERFADLRDARVAMDREIQEWADSTTPEWLAETFTWTSRAYGFSQTQPRWVLVTQMFNHQTHHRGQLTTLLMQLGIDPGVTDVPLMPVLWEGGKVPLLVK